MSDVLILASSSPQRARLLEGIGVEFEVIPSAVDEDGHGERDPEKRAQVLAKLKAQDIAKDHPDRWVLGADTLVVSEKGTLLEKPANEDEARAMLREQSDATSIVHSAVCLIAPDGKISEGIDTSSVHFRPLSAEDIGWWMSTNLWQGRSGGFQIDGPGQLMIERIEGDWSGIVGLPIFLFGRLASRAGLRIN